jgi:hypothetical protein
MVLLAVASWRRTRSSTSPNFPNSLFTAPSTRQTSLERRSIAMVRNPIRRLLRIAASVVGPATTTRHSVCSSCTSPGCRSTSA